MSFTYQPIVVYGDIDEATKAAAADNGGVFEIVPTNKDARNIYIFGGESTIHTGIDAIKELERLGGLNTHGLSGNESAEALYFISPCRKTIEYVSSPEHIAAMQVGRTEIILPEKPRYKDGDIVIMSMGFIGKVGSTECVELYDCDNPIKEIFHTPLNSNDPDIVSIADDSQALLYRMIVDWGVKNTDSPTVYDKVLIRNCDDEQWKKAMFSAMYGAYYACLYYTSTINESSETAFYVQGLQCVLEAENEHLLNN